MLSAALGTGVRESDPNWWRIGAIRRLYHIEDAQYTAHVVGSCFLAYGKAARRTRGAEPGKN